MRVERFLTILGGEFYVGVPDSRLKAVCDTLIARYGVDGKRHLIAANEGNALAVAAGYHLATGKVPVVYLQNSGTGNLVNPLASLCNPAVYGIPAVFLVGWRGEPGVHDEPQHVFQGRVTLRLLEDMEIACRVVDKNTTEPELLRTAAEFRTLLAAGKQVAYVIRKGALEGGPAAVYGNRYPMRREEILAHVLRFSGGDPVVSTTGKASRELYELREGQGMGHARDFLTVGSMGHASSIALGIALHRPEKRVWCVDGDGAALMHLGALAVIGAARPENLIHILVNNEAHESVGGQPNASRGVDYPAAARACGYPRAYRAETPEELEAALQACTARAGLCLIEARCAIGARPELGRPKGTPWDNREAIMAFLGE